MGEENSNKEPEAASPNIGLLPSVHFQDIVCGTAEKITSGEISLWINKQGYMDQTILHLADDEDKIISLVLSPFLSTIKAYDTYISLE